MTLQEINDLLIEDVQEILEAREIEFAEYKAELIAAENERLRVQDLNDRIEALSDANHAHAVIYPDVPNAALHRKNTILTNPDKVAAEANLVILEAKDKELSDAAKAVEYIALRKAEYPSIEELVIAIVEEDITTLDNLKAARQLIKQKYPKV